MIDYVKSQHAYGTEINKKITLTVLFRNPSARCCAPSSPIPFSERSNVVSVCVENSTRFIEKDQQKIILTLLVRNARARCCAPSSPI